MFRSRYLFLAIGLLSLSPLFWIYSATSSSPSLRAGSEAVKANADSTDSSGLGATKAFCDKRVMNPIESATRLDYVPYVRKPPPASCNIEHVSAQGLDNIKQVANNRPLILTGWPLPRKIWERESFLQKHGRYAQVLKNELVVPLHAGKEQCAANTSDTFEALSMSLQNLLFFTNEKENEAFMTSIRNEYTKPPAIKDVKGFEVFSAMTEASSHQIHRHGESWLAQVHGRKIWWFLPPDEVVKKESKINACAYLQDPHKVPTGALSCIQQPGEVMWFPHKWWHATCSLDAWSVAIGGQAGSPSVEGIHVPTSVPVRKEPVAAM